MATASEVRVMSEGTLRWVQQSGSGRTWATGATQPSGIVGLVQPGFTWSSAKTITTISERGVPDHHKVTEFAPIKGSFQVLATGTFPTQITSSGTTVPMMALELRHSAAELGSNSAVYHQFMGVPFDSFKYTEAKEGNKYDVTFIALACTTFTGSGYLS